MARTAMSGSFTKTDAAKASAPKSRAVGLNRNFSPVFSPTDSASPMATAVTPRSTSCIATITRRAQADRPPPKLARLILLKARASSSRRGFVAGSLMHEGGVMHKLILLLFGRFPNRIGRFVFPRRLPVALIHGRQVVHDGRIIQLHGDLPPQVECWLIKVL